MNRVPSGRGGSTRTNACAALYVEAVRVPPSTFASRLPTPSYSYARS